MDSVPTIPVISLSVTGKGGGSHGCTSKANSDPSCHSSETTRTAASYSSPSPSFPSHPTLPFFLPPTSFPASTQWGPPLSGCLKDLPTLRAGPQNRKQLLASTEKEKNHKIQGCLCLQVTAASRGGKRPCSARSWSFSCA